MIRLKISFNKDLLVFTNPLYIKDSVMTGDKEFFMKTIESNIENNIYADISLPLNKIISLYPRLLT